MSSAKDWKPSMDLAALEGENVFTAIATVGGVLKRFKGREERDRFYGHVKGTSSYAQAFEVMRQYVDDSGASQ